jgi:hypothetical protein
MIYSEAFDALPAALKGAIYERIWIVLSGGVEGKRYARLGPLDRSSLGFVRKV